jgi:hypothetical protein
MMKLNELDTFPELGNTMVLDGTVYVKKCEPFGPEELMKQIKTNRVFYQEGYAQAELDLKREPLSDEEMRAIWKEGIRGEIPFVEIGRAIEKAHGIGGEE